MAERGAAPTEILSEARVAAIVETMADAIAPRIDDETVFVCMLTGGIWFTADLSRALARRGRNPLFDSLWVSSYADGRTTTGVVQIRAGLQRPVQGRRVLLVDDVVESGLSLAESARIMRESGASQVLTAVFARKPITSPRAIEPDFKGWDAPDRFLVGYGMDMAGRLRGLGGVAALD
jgi:hypoxanthine phosphoribosyltransferase